VINDSFETQGPRYFGGLDPENGGQPTKIRSQVGSGNYDSSNNPQIRKQNNDNKCCNHIGIYRNNRDIICNRDDDDHHVLFIRY